ncbi:MAG: hypothetical protein IJJ29_01975 [Solobacterium sp.]|nr:hypothetical protein [Solobacterium sp.]
MKDEKEKYTFLQFKEISLGRAHGLSEEEIKLYAKPSLNYLQMQIIREDLERGTDHEKVRYIAKPWLSIEEMLDLQQELTQKTVAEMPLLIRRRSLIFMILCLLVPLCSGIYLLYRHIQPADPLILKLREDAVTVSEGDIFEPSLYISDTSGRGAKLQMPERFTAEEPGTRLLVYRLHRGKEEVLRYLRVTTRENKAPVLILETDEITVQDGEETDCYRYIAEASDPEDGDLRAKVTCEVSAEEEEQYLLYSVSDHQGKRAEARLRVVFAEEVQPVAYVPKAVYIPKPAAPVLNEPPGQEDLSLSLQFSMDS